MPSSVRLTVVSLQLATATVLAACSFKAESTSSSDRDESVKVTVGVPGNATTAGSTEAPLAAGDVRIKSTDGVLVLSLIGDTVRFQLSDSLRNSVADEIRKDGDSSGDKSGIAALVTKSVAGVVKTAMGFTVRAAAKDVQNLRYEDGHIRFDIRNSTSKVNVSGDDHKSSTFTEDDAKRFIDAVNAKAGHGAM
jgi:hypothetical protein